MARKSEEVSRAKGKRRIKYQRGSERGQQNVVVSCSLSGLESFHGGLKGEEIGFR